jgi:beta-glucosidase
MKEKVLKFPEGFLWGSSVSSYQTEGGIDNCDWSHFFPAGKACDHYNRYEDDFDLIRMLNQNAFRFSLEWSRIEPREGEFDQKELDHYKKVLMALRERGIKSFVTLNHWTLPVWFMEKGGWLNSKSPDYFSNYVKKAAKELGRCVDFWITFNEPMIYTGHSYVKGEWPPQNKSLLRGYKVLKRLGKAHKESYRIIHSFNNKAKVSIAKSNIFFEAYDNKKINRFLVKIADCFWNDYFLNYIKEEIDFIGLNYYFHRKLRFSFSKPGNWLDHNENKIVSDLAWEIYPEGIYHVLKSLARFKKPIYITENGLADANDSLRENFIRDHLLMIHRATREGVDVRGYLHWSLMDNLEWDKGFRPKFGLVEIDYETMARIPRSSAFFYANICKNNSLEI